MDQSKIYIRATCQDKDHKIGYTFTQDKWRKYTEGSKTSLRYRNNDSYCYDNEQWCDLNICFSDVNGHVRIYSHNHKYLFTPTHHWTEPLIIPNDAECAIITISELVSQKHCLTCRCHTEETRQVVVIPWTLLSQQDKIDRNISIPISSNYITHINLTRYDEGYILDSFTPKYPLLF
jgi:hypothetical protein